MSDDTLHLGFGTGPLGKSVMRALLDRNQRVRMLNRSGKADVPIGVEVVSADLYQPDSVCRAAQGVTVAYQCAQPAYNEWTAKFPPLQASIIDGLDGTGARLVIGDNLYMVDNTGGAPIREDTPYNAVTRKGRVRAAMNEAALAAHRAGKLPVALVRASDFYGPEALSSAVGERVFPPLLKGKPVQVLGDPDILHTFTCIGDFGTAMALVGERESAFGQAWHVPTAGPISTREFLQMAARIAGVELKITRLTPLMLRLVGVFLPVVREVAEMQYQWAHPYLVDHTKFIGEFGDIATPRATALERTLEWYREHVNRD